MKSILEILILGVMISVFLTVLSLGMRASLNDLVCLFRRPGLLIRALLSMFLIMPIVAILMVKSFDLDPVIKVALVVLSVSPIPPLFPKKAFKSGGEASFTFGLLAAISLLSIVAIPLVFVLFNAVFIREAKFSESWIVQTILVKILLPLVIGMVFRQFAPAWSERYGQIVERAGGILLLASFLPVLILTLPTIWSLIGVPTILAIVLFALVGAASGYFLGGPDPNERVVLAMATATRHPGIAITLAITNAAETPKKLLVAAVILYLIVSAIAVTPFLKWLSGRKTSIGTISRKSA
jgi:bile acid:Na+ symporter, BASS family